MGKTVTYREENGYVVGSINIPGRAPIVARAKIQYPPEVGFSFGNLAKKVASKATASAKAVAKTAASSSLIKAAVSQLPGGALVQSAASTLVLAKGGNKQAQEKIEKVKAAAKADIPEAKKDLAALKLAAEVADEEVQRDKAIEKKNLVTARSRYLTGVRTGFPG